MSSFERPTLPPSPERTFHDPKKREQKLLERFQSPIGRWLSMAALALSAEGCAEFKPVLRVFTQGVTLESKKIKGSDIGFSASPEGPSMKVKYTLEGQGDAAWWEKPEGVFLPPAARERMLQKRLSQELVFAHLPKEMRFLKPPVISSQAWIPFVQKNGKFMERPPTEPVAYVHHEKRESMEHLLTRIVDQVMDISEPTDGVQITWRTATPVGPSRISRARAEERMSKESFIQSSAGEAVDSMTEGRAGRLKDQEWIDERALPMDRETEMKRELSLDRGIRGLGMGTEKNTKPPKQKESSTTELRKSIPGKFIWTEAAFSRFLDEQRLNAMLGEAQGHEEIAARVSPLIDSTPKKELQPGASLEDEAVKNVWVIQDGAMDFSRAMSSKYPDRLAQFVSVAKRPIPALESGSIQNVSLEQIGLEEVVGILQQEGLQQELVNFVESGQQNVSIELPLPKGDITKTDIDQLNTHVLGLPIVQKLMERLKEAGAKRIQFIFSEQKGSLDQFTQQMLDEQAIRMAKRSALMQTARILTKLGLEQMRFHVIINPERTELAVVAVVDHPRLPQAMQEAMKRSVQ